MLSEEEAVKLIEEVVSIFKKPLSIDAISGMGNSEEEEAFFHCVCMRMITNGELMATGNWKVEIFRRKSSKRKRKQLRKRKKTSG